MYRNRTDLPETRHIVTSNRVGDLADAISLAIEPSREVSHTEPIHDDDKLGSHLWWTEEHPGANPIVIDRSPGGMAKFLIRMASPGEHPLRYPPRPSPNARRGWSISAVTIDGVIAVFVETAWVAEPALA